MTLIVPTTPEPARRPAARRRTPPMRKASVVQPSGAALNRRALRSELIALYSQYEADIRCANRIEAENVHLADEADNARRNARRRMSLIAQLLDSEYPGWDADARMAQQAEP